LVRHGGSLGRILVVAVVVASLVFMIAVSSIAYSVFALCQSLASVVHSISAASSSGSFPAAFNFTNRGLFPATLRISANISAAGASLSTASRRLELQPGETGSFNLSFPLSLESPASHPYMLQAVLLTGANVSLDLRVTLALSPFLNASRTSSESMKVSPVMSEFYVNAEPLQAYNSTDFEVLLPYSFFNGSPLSLSGNMSVWITNSPTGGTFVGCGTGAFEAHPSSLNHGEVEVIVSQVLRMKPYYANITITSLGETASVVIPVYLYRAG
jgi:hypothetical protein